MARLHSSVPLHPGKKDLGAAPAKMDHNGAEVYQVLKAGTPGTPSLVLVGPLWSLNWFDIANDQWPM